MTDNPIELLAAMESSWDAMDESAREDQRRIRRAEIAALEACGFRIAHPESYTSQMMATTARLYLPGDLKPQPFGAGGRAV